MNFRQFIENQLPIDITNNQLLLAALRRWYDFNDLILKNPENELSKTFFHFVDNIPPKNITVYRGISGWMLEGQDKVYNQPMRYVSASHNPEAAKKFAKPILMKFINVPVKDISKYVDYAVVGHGKFGNSQDELLIPAGTYRIIDKKQEGDLTLMTVSH